MDLSPAALVSRIESAERYFRYLRSAMNGVYPELLAKYDEGGMPILEALVLINPVWNDLGPGQAGRQRSFRNSPPPYERCASSVIWGYECPFEQILEVDHLFPFALGGPSRPENSIYLCREHNRAKGHDVHLIPWEAHGAFAWLPEEISTARLRCN